MKLIIAENFKKAVYKKMAGRGVTTPDDALYEEEIMELIEQMPGIVISNQTYHAICETIVKCEEK